MTTLQEFRSADSAHKQQVAEVSAAMNADPRGTHNLSLALSLLGRRPGAFGSLERHVQESVIRLAAIGFSHCMSGVLEALLMERGEV